MRILSEEDLQTITGGLYMLDMPDEGGGGIGDYVEMTNTGNGYEITPTQAIDDQTLMNYQNASNTMDSTGLSNYVAATAQDWGFPVGPFTITPIINPFSGPNQIRIGGKARISC